MDDKQLKDIRKRADKATPGPWEIRQVTVWSGGLDYKKVVANDNDDIASVRPGLTASDANAHLIAAAPDMLEALEDVYHQTVDTGMYPDGPCLDKETRQSIKSIIAKARGCE